MKTFILDRFQTLYRRERNSFSGGLLIGVKDLCTKSNQGNQGSSGNQKECNSGTKTRHGKQTYTTKKIK